MSNVVQALLCGALMWFCAAALAQPRALLSTEPIMLDGRLDEAAWRDAPVYERFVQYLPVDRQPAPSGYRTTVQVLLQADALVIGVRAVDPQPERIRAPLVRRDQVRSDQDFVGVVIDPAGDRRSAQFLRINAAGVLTDGIYVAAGDVEDFAPDFGFEGAAARLPDGYSVEVRLPFIALRYPQQLEAPWRLMVMRSVAREQRLLLLSAPLTKDGLSFIAELEPIDGLEALPGYLNGAALMQITPELTLRRSKRSAPDEHERQDRASVGVDLKWRPRADWVFDATLNPDFAQVELDVPQLAGNTRFALSVPEKRGFFLESTDVIDLPLAGFYSRSVADPRWGLRATWRGASADATALALRDEGGGSVLRPAAYSTEVFAPDTASDSAMVRARMHGRVATTGVLASSRQYAQGLGGNQVLGADVFGASVPQQQWRLRVLASQTTAGFDAQGQMQRTVSERGRWLEGRWELRNEDWIVKALWRYVSPRFRNDNGFVEQAGVRRAETELNRRWGEVAWGPFKAHEFETFVWMQHTQARRDPVHGIDNPHTQSARWHTGIWWAGSRNGDGLVNLLIDRERARPAQAGGRLWPVRRVEAEYGFNPAPWFTRAFAALEAGDFLDVQADRVGSGRQFTLDTQLRGTIGPWGVESQQRVEQLTLRHAGTTALRETTANWLGVLHLSPRDTVRVTWQTSHGRRSADATVGLLAQAYRERSSSLVYQHQAQGRRWSVGWIEEASEPDGARKAEAFVKLSRQF